MTATYVIGAWFAIATVLTLCWGRLGYLRHHVLPVDHPRKLREHSRHDGLEGFGFSQGVHSLHNGGNTL